MLTLLKYIIYIPLAVLLVAFAVANHHFVTVSIDPFSGRENTALSFDAPLFVVIILSLMIGVIAGGLAMWFGQGRYRRSSRHFRIEAEKLKASLQAAEPKSDTKLIRRA